MTYNQTFNKDTMTYNQNFSKEKMTYNQNFSKETMAYNQNFSKETMPYNQNFTFQYAKPVGKTIPLFLPQPFSLSWVGRKRVPLSCNTLSRDKMCICWSTEHELFACSIFIVTLTCQVPNWLGRTNLSPMCRHTRLPERILPEASGVPLLPRMVRTPLPEP